jgi:MSHA biogenesis protein MshJ
MKYKNEQLRQLAARINALSYRERVMVAATALVATLFLWDSMLLQGQLAHRSGVQKELNALQAEKAAATALQAGLTETLQLDPNEQEKIRLERYNQEINRIDEILKSKTLEFVSPQQMVEVLKALIDKEPGLQLTRLESTGPVSSNRGGATDDKKSVVDKALTAATAAAEGVADPKVYVHGLEMRFSGDYFSTMRYVKQLESLQWRFAWSAMSLTMKRYPKAEVWIRLETLSLTEGWIGA